MKQSQIKSKVINDNNVLYINSSKYQKNIAINA